MPYALLHNGTNQYTQLASAIASILNGYIEIQFRVEALDGDSFFRLFSDTINGTTTDRLILEQNGNRVIFNAGGGTSATWSGIYPGGITVGQIITLRVATTGTSAKRLYVDGDDRGTANTDFASIGRYGFLGVNFGQYSPIAVIYADVVDYDTAANTITLDATSSDHGTGTPTLVDTTNGNDATGVNMPTDGSAWEDLGGGGGTVYNLVVQSSSQLQSSQNAALSTDSVLAVSSSSQIQISSVSGLLSKSVLFLDDSSQAQVSENVSSSIGVMLSVSGSDQTQSSQGSQLITHAFIVPQLSSQAQQSDSSQLFVAGVLSVQSTANGQYSQNVTLQIDVPQITVHGSGQLSLSTSTTLLTRSMLSVSDSIQTQLSASVFFTGDIYHLDGQILMYSDLSGNLSLYPNITATLRIN